MALRSVSPLSVDQLNALTTSRLLAYRDRLLSLEESHEFSDWTDEELNEADPERLYFKADPRWQQHYAELKELLAAREHVERKRSGGGRT